MCLTWACGIGGRSWWLWPATILFILSTLYCGGWGGGESASSLPDLAGTGLKHTRLDSFHSCVAWVVPCSLNHCIITYFEMKRKAEEPSADDDRGQKTNKPVHNFECEGKCGAWHSGGYRGWHRPWVWNKYMWLCQNCYQNFCEARIHAAIVNEAAFSQQ